MWRSHHTAVARGAQIPRVDLVPGGADPAQSPLVGRDDLRRAPERTEWPTVVVAVVVWGAHLALFTWHDTMPWPLTMMAFAVLGGWYMSVQHETLHGHPTPSAALNAAIAWVPWSLWLPFRVYRDSHLLHHDIELTLPGVDPESFYVSPAAWDRMGRVRRAVRWANRTFVGRLVVGPWLGIPATVIGGLREARRNASMRRTWIAHVVGVAAVAWLVFGVFGIPWWQYLVGYVWGGLAVAYVRSFAEHFPVPAPATRCAMVRSNALMSLLFMNVNHHHTHHSLPGVAWYRLPALSRAMGAEAIATDGAGAYRGYWQIFRRYALRPLGHPVHPVAEPLPR